MKIILSSRTTIVCLAIYFTDKTANRHLMHLLLKVSKASALNVGSLSCFAVSGRFGRESFRPWVVSAGSFRPGLFRPDFRVPA